MDSSHRPPAAPLSDVPAATRSAAAEAAPTSNDTPGSRLKLDEDTGEAAARASNVRVLPAPVHALPGLTAAKARRGPGRPRRIRTAPSADQMVYERAVRTALEEHIERDLVVAASELRDRSTALIDELVLAVAGEQASIGYEILYRIRDQRDLERARSRRIDALHVLGRLVLEQRRAQVESPSVPSAIRDRVTRAFIEELRHHAVDTLGRELAERLMAAYAERIASASTGDKG